MKLSFSMWPGLHRSNKFTDSFPNWCQIVSKLNLKNELSLGFFFSVVRFPYKLEIIQSFQMGMANHTQSCSKSESFMYQERAELGAIH